MPMSRRQVALVVLSAAWFGITATVAAEQQSDRHTLRLFDVTTARGIADQKPDRPTTIFAPEDSPIYVWFRGEGCAIGTTITSVWYYVSVDPPIRLVEGAVTVGVVDDWGQFNFELGPGRTWTTGEYRVELRVGDELLAQTTFRVEAKTP